MSSVSPGLAIFIQGSSTRTATVISWPVQISPAVLARLSLAHWSFRLSGKKWMKPEGDSARSGASLSAAESV